MDFDYLKFNRSKTDKLTTITVGFSEFEDELVKIPRELLREVQKYWVIHEDDYALINILARGTMLKANNFALNRQSVRRYDFGDSKKFALKFTKKLFDLANYVSIEEISEFFNDAKVDDLDCLLNRESAYEFATHRI